MAVLFRPFYILALKKNEVSNLMIFNKTFGVKQAFMRVRKELFALFPMCHIDRKYILC